MSTSLELAHTDTRRDTPLGAVFTDEAQFRAWYEGVLPSVYGYLFNRCGRNQDLAEELTQQTFVEAVRGRDGFREGEPLAWLIGIARHRLVDHFRRLERRESGFRRLLATHPPMVVWLGDTASGDDELAAALDRLPAAQRAALMLRYVDDLPVREVSRLMRRSEGAVESLLSRGRDALRRSYRTEPR
jgi:RNA polymerase sigma-70 factor (ECF subfamily)